MTEYRFDTPGALPLLVEIGRGVVQIAADRADRCLVEVTGPGADDVEVQLTQGTLSVIQPSRAGFLRSREVRVRMNVPAGSSPAIRTGSADITLTGSVLQTEIHTGSGDVSAELITGSALIETGSGDVVVEELHAPLRLKSGSGDLRVRHAGAPVAASTGTGDVRIDTSEGPVVTKTGSGDLAIRHAYADVGWQTGTGDLTIGQIDGGTVRAKTASGDVSLGVPRGLAVWTDIRTTTGDVTSNLDAVGAPGEDVDYLDVRVTSATGDVSLHQADECLAG